MTDVPATQPVQQHPVQAVREAAAVQALRGVPVETAPPVTQQATTDGRISPGQTPSGEIHIATAEGEIVVKSQASLPPDARVKVEVYLEQAQLRANITVIREQQAQDEAIKDVATPVVKTPLPPPLKTGDVVAALFMPDDAPAPEQQNAPRPLPLETVAKVVEALKQAGIKALPPSLPQGFPPVPLPLQKILNAPQPLPVLLSLPVQEQVEITMFFAKPIVMDALKTLLPQQALDKAGLTPAQFQQPAAMPQDIVPDVPETVMHKLLQFLRPATVQTQASVVTPDTPRGMLAPLLSVMENILPAVTPRVEEGLRAFLPLPENMHRLTIQQVIAPAQKTAAILPQGVTEGVVESKTRDGAAIIKTGEGRFVLKTPVEVPVGSTLRFATAPVSPREAMTMLQTWPHDDMFDPLTAKTWPAMQDAVHAAMGGRAHNVANTIPSPAARFTPAALFFLAALRLGGIEKWIGDDALKALEKRPLAARLGGDFMKISEQSKETLPGGWRLISMPLLHEEQVSQMQFYIRQQQEREQGDDKQDSKPATRFILNLNLSRMGDMQLDGYLRKKQFDLVLRTRDALPLDMRQELMRRFSDALEQTRMQGGISFQAQNKGWVTVSGQDAGGIVA